MSKDVKSYKIAVIGGDGTGPEFVLEIIKDGVLLEHI